MPLRSMWSMGMLPLGCLLILPLPGAFARQLPIKPLRGCYGWYLDLRFGCLSCRCFGGGSVPVAIDPRDRERAEAQDRTKRPLILPVGHL
jgi:hypothetical protein